MHDDYAKPGPPHVIRWVAPWEATIADAAGVIAIVRVAPALPFDLLVVREPATAEGEANLRSSLNWLLEEHERRLVAEAGEVAPGQGGGA